MSPPEPEPDLDAGGDPLDGLDLEPEAEDLNDGHDWEWSP